MISEAKNQVGLFGHGLPERSARANRTTATTFVTPVCRVSMICESKFSCRGEPLNSTELAKEYFLGYFRDRGEDREVFVCVSLDTKLVPLHLERVSVGTLDASLVHPREVFKSVLLVGASAIIVAHNHPSGDTTPSTEDRHVTDRLRDAGKLLGIELIDHIIVGHDQAVSLREID